MEMTKERNGSVTDRKGTRPLYDVTFNGCICVSGVEEAEVDEIINEHDTLKAKAELLDNAIESLGDCVRSMKSFQPNNPFKGTNTLLNAEVVLFNAKELSK